MRTHGRDHGKIIQTFYEKVEPVETDDGSLTYRSLRHDTTYRSTRGAKSESKHVFVDGTARSPSGVWHVLELGFGTGRNFATTIEHLDGPIVYIALEPAPIDPRFWCVPSPWGDVTFDEPLQIDDVTLHISTKRWQSFESELRFDAYYHDPFAPDANPDCWTTDCFVWAKALMKPDAILATYGASSAARRAMRDAGLFVASLPGAPGKREMTIASPHREQLAHAKAWGER